MTDIHNQLRCSVIGVGAWGPGFNNWAELKDSLVSQHDSQSLKTIPPKPEVIPANERRRSPLPVKIAVETSWQALQQAQVSAADVACVFGSGLGDTEITDYMCRVLTTDLKQLSPTKFHNSVHNAAAGYWTISTHCMKSANSVAAYHETAALCLLEGISQAVYQDDYMLITLFDTQAHSVYSDIFSCRQDFAAAILLSPRIEQNALADLSISLQEGTCALPPISCAHLQTLYETNPAAKILKLLETLIPQNIEAQDFDLPLSPSSHLKIEIAKTS